MRLLAVLLLLLLWPMLASAHEEDVMAVEEAPRIDDNIASTTITAIVLGSAVIVVLVAVSLLLREKSERAKKALFAGIAIPVVLVTAYTAGGTVYLNLISETGGPVHWHADFEIWNCGERVELVDPEGLENRIGSPVFHEHGDQRIHIEGVVVEGSHVDLHSFFEVIGGELTDTSLTVPTNHGAMTLQDGDLCNGREAHLQAFLYRVTNAYPSQRTGFMVEQVKLDDFAEYVPAPYGNVPPGDCIIIELDEEKERTDRICETYTIAIRNGDAEVIG